LKRTGRTTPEVTVVVAPPGGKAAPEQAETVINYLVDLVIGLCGGAGGSSNQTRSPEPDKRDWEEERDGDP